MPNWCENEICISGPCKDLKEFLTIVGFDTSEFKFNNLIPIPEDLKTVYSGHTTIDGIDCTEWRKVDGKNVFISQEELNFFDTEYGVRNGNDWGYKYWGTKWDAVDVNYFSEEIEEYQETSDIEVHFSTAWGPPEELYTYLRLTYPNLYFDWFYKEPGMRFAGWLGQE